MTETPDRPLSDDDIETVGEPAGSEIPASGHDADGTDHGADADTQDHGPGGHDTDGTDGRDTDGGDTDGTDSSGA